MSETQNTVQENDLPPAFVMWKMFHSTITALFKNLDNAENNLQALANTILSSKEFADIFIPRYDASLTFGQNPILEKKYQAFITWLLGRFFYLLSCEKFERIHDLFIQTQQKILCALKLNQPHVFNTMIKQYDLALSTVIKYLNSTSIQSCNPEKLILSIENFHTEQLLEKDGLDLAPKFIQLDSTTTCLLLQHQLLKILTEASLDYIDSNWLGDTAVSILNNIECSFQNCRLVTKTLIVKYCSRLLQQSYLVVNSSPFFEKHFRDLLYCLEFVVCQDDNFCLEETRDFEIELCEFFTVVQKYILGDNEYIREKCRNICEILLRNQLTKMYTGHNKELLRISTGLLKSVYEHENVSCPNMEVLTKHVLRDNNCAGLNILLQYEICRDVKLYAMLRLNDTIDLLSVSHTWRLLYDQLSSNLDLCNEGKTDLKDVYTSLHFMKNIFKIAQNVYVEIYEWYSFTYERVTNTYQSLRLNFVRLEELVAQLKNVISSYKISTSAETEELLDLIVDSVAAFFSFNVITQSNIKEFKNMVELICYPFWRHVELRELIMIPGLITDDFNEETRTVKRMKAIEILSGCLINIEETNQQCFNMIKIWILAICKFYISTNNSYLLMQVAKRLLNIASTVRGVSEIIYDILRQLLSLSDHKVTETLSEYLGQIICVLSGSYTISPEILDNNIVNKVFCLKCDYLISETVMKDQSESLDQGTKLIRKIDNKCCTCQMFITQKSVQNVNLSVITSLLDTKNNSVKINMVKNFLRFSNHISGFNTAEVSGQWLKYLVDENKEVRRSLIPMIKPLVHQCQSNESRASNSKSEILDLGLNKLLAVSKEYLLLGDVEILETILETIKEFGCLSSPLVVYPVTKLLVCHLILCNSYLSLATVEHLKHVSKMHNMTPNSIFVKYKKNICKVIADMSVFAYCAKEYNIVQTLERIAVVFEFTMKDFITRNGHHLLPHFIPHFVKVSGSAKILTDIANLMVVESSDLITSNFSYIYTYVYLHEDAKIFQGSMKFVESITRSSVAVLKKRSIKVIHNELLMHFHDKRELVLEELHALSQEDNDVNQEPSLRNSTIVQQVSFYLQPRFLGVLVYFDSKLVSKHVDESVKIRVLQSLPEIIKLMGIKYITPLRFKVLATLRTALSLTEEPYLELICNNWEAFIQCCEVESLGPLLSTIFVSLLPLLTLYPRKINAIFKYLIVDNEDKLKSNIQDLFFLAETNASTELKNVVKKHVFANRPETFTEQLAMFLKYINHENLEVRVFGLKFLKKHLEENCKELEQTVLGNNGMDPALVELIDVLVTGCRENDEQVRQICGECIGELGAIEPSHFPRKYTQSDSSFIFYITDDSFVINALMELSRSFQMEKHTQNMNRFALAIQEILKAYGVSPEGSTQKRKIWASFPENIQELMLPLLSSRYTVAIQSSDKILIHPIYGSQSGSSFNDWIYTWTSYLISVLTNDKRALLQVCKPSLKYDYRTLMFFLPHIMIHAVIECSDDERKLIYEEFMTVLTSSNSGKKSKMLKNRSDTPSQSMRRSDDMSTNNCINVVFVLLDYLERWLREAECVKIPKQPSVVSDDHFKTVKNFMAQFCLLYIAECNFVRGEYPRALMYLEQHVAGDKNKLNEQLGFFARIYAELEEPDGVAGAMAMQETEPSLQDMILAHSLSGQLQDAAACYERMAQEPTFEPQYLKDMVRCYLELDNPFAAFNIANGAMEAYPEYKTMLYESQVEALWRLSMYDKLDEVVSKPEMKHSCSWGVRIGKALLHFRKGNREEFRKEINDVRKHSVDMLSVTSLEEGVYRHGYPHIIKLHILNELEKAEETFYKIMQLADKSQSDQLINNLVQEWDVRLKVVQSSVRTIEPILRLRRIILEQSQSVLGTEVQHVKSALENHIAKYWLKSAEIARRACIFQQAYIFLLKAEQYKPMELFVEKAKLYWAKEEQEMAFNTLKRGVEEHFPDAVTFKEMNPSIRKVERKLCAEAKLLIATYNDETSNVDMDVNICNYREAVEMYREWEKSQVCLAQYYDRVFSTMSDEDKDTKGGDIQIHIINCFGKSLQYGSTFIYQSMPRMLSIWLDYGTRIVESRPTDDSAARDMKKSTLIKMIKLIDTYLDRLPAYMFLSAFSQLVSRICHPVREVYLQIKSILIKLILKYPQQSMWMIMSVSKSAYAVRTKRCQEVLQDHLLKNSRVMKLIFDFNRLADKLIELCNKPISDGVVNATVNTLIKTLPRLLQNKDFSEIILPIQKLRKLVLPTSELSNSQYDPFPNTYVYIVGIEDEVNILQSLQRPRKITFRGSDGKKYIHMLKPKDDLRKDCRLMEFNDVVNLYLHREAESRQRRLCIRTYSVVPLNEECGIVEWMDNLVGLRPILMKIYRQRGLYVTARDLKSMMCNVRDPLSRKREVFERQLLPKHPPVLADWFRYTFPDAHCWFRARTAYVRTSAVISMVGYVLGLGDRHGENILFDTTNGDTVHVDFNCLFNKGESFDWPERVPFRLTHNMVSAMGPLGVDGMFRKACAVTLKVLRTHIDTLMSIVRPFVYDPLVSWPRNQLLKNELPEAERTNEQAVEHIRNIELRLKGMIKTRGKSFSISLSCEGQANNLILEATSIDNLSQMYIGWGPFL